MADPNTYYLFVYGSLRSGFQSPAYAYISPYFDLIGEGKVRGKLFDMGEYCAGVPVKENAFILGELYKIKNEGEFSWAMGQLDDYEGIMPELGEEQLFRRELTEIFLDDRTVQSWIYWYNSSVEGRPHIASGDVLTYRPNK